MTNKKHSQGISRRHLMQLTGAGVLAAGLGATVIDPNPASAAEDSKITAVTAPNPASAAEVPKITAEQALQKLKEGNERYVAFKRTYPDQDAVRLKLLAQEQHPFAVILGCSDSRVPPELLFDQGLGDLFVIRVAGNILDDATLASIEFAAEELKVPLVMVLGHERCGAVKATLEGGGVPGHVSRLVEAIQPAVARVKAAVAQGKDETDNELDKVVRANIRMVVGHIASSQPVLAKLVQQGKLKVVGGRYDLDEGAVEIFA
jgi:carbonic anhydrase